MALAWLGKTDSFAKPNNPTLDLTLSAALFLTASTHSKSCDPGLMELLSALELRKDATRVQVEELFQCNRMPPTWTVRQARILSREGVEPSYCRLLERTVEFTALLPRSSLHVS
jgi:hypothetical protein